MRLSFALDDFGRLNCELSDGAVQATASASNMPVAAVELLRALEDASKTGHRRVLVARGAGEYRWVIRRDGQRATLVVLWSGGTLTGWEHVFWGLDDFESLDASIRSGLSSLPVHAG